MIKLKGKIVFDPQNYTKKQYSQASWKKIAMIVFDNDVSEYYAWFIKKRYNLNLNKPLRGAHISFINDSMKDLRKSLETDDKGVEQRWEHVKSMWNNKEIEICINPDVRSDSIHWWLIVPQENRKFLHVIRAQLGLGRPYFGIHMSIGYAAHLQLEHSKKIQNLIVKYGGSYN
jgi:hypothetical protein